MTGPLDTAMIKRLFLLLFVPVTIACSCGHEGHHKVTNPETVSKEQVITEDDNRIGDHLQAFLSQNEKPVKQWPFKEWGYRLHGNRLVFKMPKGKTISGEALKEFLSIDAVNHYDSLFNMSKGEWVERLLQSNTEYKYCGTIDVADSLDCYIYTEADEKQVGYHDAFALIAKNGVAVSSFQIACEGYGMFDSIESNRISRNTFVMSSVAVDMIDEDGENIGGYYSIRINDDGTLIRSESLESAFNMPTWK